VDPLAKLAPPPGSNLLLRYWSYLVDSKICREKKALI